MLYRHLMIYWSIPSFVCLIQLIRSDCEFPRQWWGRWYQPSVGDVIIRSNDISTKGTCYEQYRDFFLVENRREHCHQCLLILRRHTNIIQFSESYCIGRDALQSICNQMRVDRVGSMHTIVRDGALPVPCPLLKAFHFTYNNQSGGFCRSPTSYVHQCASASMMRFNFKHCRHCLNAFDRGVEFECLATWKDGPDHFAYGRFLDNDDAHSAAPSSSVRELSYRCFIYQKIGSVVNMAVSSDATCRGLRSPKDGPLVIEMTEDVYGWPSPRCTYPPSLKSSSWTEISGRLTFTVNSANDVITIHSQRKHSTATTHARATLKCLKTDQSQNASSANLVSDDDDDDVTGQISNYSNITVLAHVLEKCQSRHRCLRFQRRHAQLMHLYAGSYVRDVRASCTDDDFSGEHSQSFLLIAAAAAAPHDGHIHHHQNQRDDQTLQQQQQQQQPHQHRGSKCPLKGRYVPLRDESDTCQWEMRIGCLQPDQLQIVSSCQSQHPLLQLVCLFSWREHPSVFLVARRTDNNQTGCYHLQHHHSHFTIAASEHCSHSDNGGGEKSVSPAFVFQPVREKCREHVIRSEVESDGMKKASVGTGNEVIGGGDGDEDQTNDVSLIRSTLGKETPSKREQYNSHLALGNTAAGASASATPSSSTRLSIIASAFVVCLLFIFRTIDADPFFCSAFSSLVVPRCRRQSIGNAVRGDVDIRCRIRSSYAMQSGVG